MTQMRSAIESSNCTDLKGFFLIDEVNSFQLTVQL